jgi:hypothetical protein
MDRRRYTPSAEGLEGRALMSLFGGKVSSANTNLNVSIQDLPETFRQKENRIDHLPFYLQQEDPNRFLPADAIRQIQTDMRSVIAELHAPSKPVTDAFNVGLRHLLPYKTLSRQNAFRLSQQFGDVLLTAGATPDQVASFQQSMGELAKVDALSTQPSQFARQDYALVLQTTLAVGRPMQTPTPGLLAVKDGVRTKDSKGGFTRDHNPTLVGTYEAGATRIGYARMQILDDAGDVLGTGVVDVNGAYSVKLATFLPDGTYHLRTRAVDEVGHVSDPSPHAFTLKVVTRPAPRAALVRTTTVTTTAAAAATTPSTTDPVATLTSPAPSPAAQTLRPPAGPLGLN